MKGKEEKKEKVAAAAVRRLDKKPEREGERGCLRKDVLWSQRRAERMEVVEVMRKRPLCGKCWQPCLSVYERRVRRSWMWKIQESDVEMRKMTSRADRAENDKQS